MAPKYLLNFSVFQSAADHWAIDQLLPVAPLMRLNERPNRRCALVDITCDSDGRMKHFLDSGEIKRTLPLHQLKEGEEYFVGLFLTGAYQDVMGDMHNLFGRPHEIHVFQHDDATGFYFEEVIRGPSSGSVLSTMQYTPGQLIYTVKKKIDKMIRQGAMGQREGLAPGPTLREGLRELHLPKMRCVILDSWGSALERKRISWPRFLPIPCLLGP